MIFFVFIFIFLHFSTYLLICCEGLDPLSTSIHANDNIETRSIVSSIPGLEDDLVVVNNTQVTTNDETSLTKDHPSISMTYNSTTTSKPLDSNISNRIKSKSDLKYLEASKENKNKKNPTLKRRLRISKKQRDKIRIELNRDRDASGNLENNSAWKSLRDLEEDGCVRRFLCELAAGHIVTSDNDSNYKLLVKQLIHFVDRTNERDKKNKNVLIYAEAAKSGSRHLDVEKCRVKYPCPATGSQIYSLFRLTSNRSSASR